MKDIHSNYRDYMSLSGILSFRLDLTHWYKFLNSAKQFSQKDCLQVCKSIRKIDIDGIDQILSAQL